MSYNVGIDFVVVLYMLILSDYKEGVSIDLLIDTVFWSNFKVCYILILKCILYII